MLITGAAAGVFGVIMAASIARADPSLIFVRSDGHDLFCDGSVDAAYANETAPACAVQTVLRAIELAAPDGQVRLFAGGESITIPLASSGDMISALSVTTTLTVTKSDSPDPVDVNFPLTYTITISNMGSSNTSQVFLIDTLPLPGIVTFNSAQASQGSCNPLASWVISCTLGALNVGSEAVVTMVVTTTAAGLLNNVAVVSSPDAVTTFASAETQVRGSTDLSIRKTAFPTPTVAVNTPLTYTITVSNSGPAAAAATILTDTLPTGVLPGPLPPGCTYITPTLTCNNLGVLGVGASTAITFLVTPTVVGVITNTAGITVTGGASDPNLTNNLATQTTQVVAPANLIITKTVFSTAPSVGKVTTFTVAYQNLGPFTATGVVITDFLASNVNYVTDTWGVLPITSPTTVQWNLPNLAPGQSGSFYVGLNLDPAIACSGTTSFTNTARIAAAQADLDNTNNISTIQSGSIPCNVDLVVVKNDNIGTGTSRLKALGGEYITYTISVNNVGAQTANSVVLTETLPANTTFVGPTGPLGWTQISPGTYTYIVGNLANGAGQIIPFIVQVIPSLGCAITETVNTVQAGSSGPEAFAADNISVEQAPVGCNPVSLLQVRKDDGVTCAAPNQTLTYTITYSNPGGTAVNNVSLTDFKPNYTNFLPGNDWVEAGSGVYTRALGTVSPGGGQGPVYFQVQLVDPSAIPATVTAITNVIQISGGQTYTEVTAVPLSPDLVVAKNDNIGVTAASAGFVQLYQQVAGEMPPLEAQATNVAPGDFIEYTVVFANNGRGTATNVVLTDTLPLYTTYVGGSEWTNVSGQLYRHIVGSLNPGQGGFLTFRVQVANSLPASLEWIINRVDIGGSEGECNLSNSSSYEQTPVTATTPPTQSTTIYLPIIMKEQSSTSPQPPVATSTPIPLAYVADVKADPETNQIFVASPRHDWVYVINGSDDTLDRNVPVGHGPTGLTVLAGSSSANNKVFVAHQYGANDWHPGFMAFGVTEAAAHQTEDTGYAGAAPIKTAANSPNGRRVYVSNYFDKLAVFDGGTGPPEIRLGWVKQKAFQGAYGIDASTATNRTYLATRDTGELVVFDGNNDRLLQSSYIPTHVKPPQACSLFSVAVNETTGHVFVPCPQLSRVFVLQENQVSVLDLEALGVLEERDGYLALVVSPQAAPWIANIDVPDGSGLGEEGIAANPATGRVFITNAHNNTLVILQDGNSPAYATSVGVGTTPQGVTVNPTSQKVYVGNTGSNSVTVLNEAPSFNILKTIPLTP